MAKAGNSTSPGDGGGGKGGGCCGCCGRDGGDWKGMADKKHRKCRDVLCCFLFIIFWAGMVGVGVIGFTMGDIRRVAYGTDYRGRVCGRGKHGQS